jgi:hypothetical protein
MGGRIARNRRLLAGMCAAVAILASGCADPPPARASAEMATERPHEARTVVAVVDFSGSQTSHSVGDARRYLETVVQGLSYGDRLVLLEMYRTGSRDSVGRFVQDMPKPIRADAVTSYDRRELDAARRGVLNALPIFFDPALIRAVPTTDLFTTMHIAAEHLHDAGSRPKELLLLSDMLQSTPVFEFEGARRMPPDGWLAAQTQERLLPRLEGTCVVVIGADHTTPHGQRVRRFWSDYFAATGALLDVDNYRVRAPTDVRGC